MEPSMSERTYKVPRWLDLPEKILVFTVDEFLAFVGVAGALIMFSEIWIAMPTAALVVVGMRKFKGGENSAKLLHWLYWILPDTVMRWKAIPPSHERILAG
ncbi:MAG: type IV conjugative transfer system protein TraL [Oceanibulbus sp.]|jgi:type IV conjugative transfer system protein TraL|nr:type IV conjugative transfer system protein TraL [Ponticaulis sp.]MBE95024.1 type IV conjugative transfer system protein TraL [Marinobacter sp.]MBM07792.1 type IV conjugative transfer system protein TraL [Sulfitobacter sp.]|tara:strand:- start:42667 stop:42969 length:303 start_codon:yes stop_codon:yes gene_type:complete